MGHWEFNKVDPSSVRVELTQRDQFNNDDVGLAEALVREVIQNSSDAGTGEGPVKVRFAIKTGTTSEQAELRSHLQGLKPHFDACSVDTSPLDEGPLRILTVEDFGTKGLTGAFDALDRGNFDNFWRAVGKSEKSGQFGGRWGLGKLVYSSSSRMRVFFGLTLRKNDRGQSIMGQAVLSSHAIGNNYYPAHGFYFEKRSDNGLNLQQPITNEREIQWFRDFAGVSRTWQPGL